MGFAKALIIGYEAGSLANLPTGGADCIGVPQVPREELSAFTGTRKSISEVKLTAFLIQFRPGIRSGILQRYVFARHHAIIVRGSKPSRSAIGVFLVRRDANEAIRGIGRIAGRSPTTQNCGVVGAGTEPDEIIIASYARLDHSEGTRIESGAIVKLPRSFVETPLLAQGRQYYFILGAPKHERCLRRRIRVVRSDEDAHHAVAVLV